MDNLVTEEAIFSVSFRQIMKTLTKAVGTFTYMAAKYSVDVLFVVVIPFGSDNFFVKLTLFTFFLNPSF